MHAERQRVMKLRRRGLRASPLEVAQFFTELDQHPLFSRLAGTPLLAEASSRCWAQKNIAARHKIRALGQPSDLVPGEASRDFRGDSGRRNAAAIDRLQGKPHVCKSALQWLAFQMQCRGGDRMPTKRSARNSRGISSGCEWIGLVHGTVRCSRL